MAMSEYVRALRTKIGNTVLEVPTAAVLAFDADGRVLLARHAESGSWTAPGGMIEPHETPADAAVRETWEETGVFVHLTRVIGVFGGPLCAVTYRNGDQLAWVATLFAARPLRGAPRADHEEMLDVRYFERRELATLPCRPHVRLFLDAAFRQDERAWFAPATWEPSAEHGR